MEEDGQTRIETKKEGKTFNCIKSTYFNGDKELFHNVKCSFNTGKALFIEKNPVRPSHVINLSMLDKDEENILAKEIFLNTKIAPQEHPMGGDLVIEEKAIGVYSIERNFYKDGNPPDNYAFRIKI